jgi:pimeloyl-ACP methyl ester carboxylesterase
MIHGMWVGGWVWDDYKRFFEATGYRCVAPTLRYHDAPPSGRPDPRLGTTSLLDYAEDIEKEIRALDTPPIVMGHSMGGLLAQMLASRGLASAAVLLAPAPPAGITALHLSTIRGFVSVFLTWGFWRKPVRQTFGEASNTALHTLPMEKQKEIYSRFVYESGRAAFEIGLPLLDRRGAAKVDATRVTCPMLVVVGARDRMTPPSVARKVARRYRAAATYKEFPDHTHWLVGESGRPVAEYVAEWLREHVAPAV